MENSIFNVFKENINDDYNCTTNNLYDINNVQKEYEKKVDTLLNGIFYNDINNKK